MASHRDPSWLLFSSTSASMTCQPSFSSSPFELVVLTTAWPHFRGRCWAAIRVSHRPEPSEHAVHEEVDGFDIEGQHGRRFVLLRHTHRTQKRPCLICVNRSGNVRHRCGGGWVGPWLFLGGSFRVGGCQRRRWSLNGRFSWEKRQLTKIGHCNDTWQQSFRIFASKSQKS